MTEEVWGRRGTEGRSVRDMIIDDVFLRQLLGGISVHMGGTLIEVLRVLF